MSNIIRMTPDQLRRIKALIKNQCCNYDDGDCLLLDCPCPQMITYSLICKWCKTAVLPNNKELYIQLIKSVNTKKCDVCGKLFTPKSNRAKYCDKCRRIVWNKQKADYIRKSRHMCRELEP